MSATLELFDSDSEEILDSTPPSSGPPSSVLTIDVRLWLFELLDLLSDLDYLRSNLERMNLQTDSLAALNLIEQLMQKTESLSNNIDFPRSSADTQSEAIGKAGAFYSLATTIKPAPKSLLANVLSGFQQDRIDPDACRDCLFLAHDSLNSYFALFTERFQSSLAARGWVDSASAFLADLKHNIRDLPA